jgi:hypothetical protein
MSGSTPLLEFAVRNNFFVKAAWRVFMLPLIVSHGKARCG